MKLNIVSVSDKGCHNGCHAFPGTSQTCSAQKEIFKFLINFVDGENHFVLFGHHHIEICGIEKVCNIPSSQ